MLNVATEQLPPFFAVSEMPFHPDVSVVLVRINFNNLLYKSIKLLSNLEVIYIDKQDYIQSIKQKRTNYNLIRCISTFVLVFSNFGLMLCLLSIQLFVLGLHVTS